MLRVNVLLKNRVRSSSSLQPYSSLQLHIHPSSTKKNMFNALSLLSHHCPKI